MKPPLIHIGYTKTGTKWLQGYVFDAPALGFYQPVERGEEVASFIVAPNALDFDEDRARSVFGEILERQDSRPGVPVISAERLAGHPDSGGFDSQQIADRVAAVFPDSRVLIVVREQVDMLLSTYQLYVRSGGPLTLYEYANPPEMGRNRLPVFDFRHLEYDRLVRYYYDLFGRENVLVKPYEALVTDPPGYVRDIVEFAGATPEDGAIESLPFRRRVNASAPLLSLAVRRRSNIWIWRTRYNPGAPLHLPRLVVWSFVDISTRTPG